MLHTCMLAWVREHGLLFQEVLRWMLSARSEIHIHFFVCRKFLLRQMNIYLFWSNCKLMIPAPPEWRIQGIGLLIVSTALCQSRSPTTLQLESLSVWVRTKQINTTQHCVLVTIRFLSVHDRCLRSESPSLCIPGNYAITFSRPYTFWFLVLRGSSLSLL